MQDHHFTIGKSPILGRGVFATATHRRGSLVIVMLGKEISHRELLRQVARRRIRPGDPIDSFRLAKPSWVAVTGYPVTESFYDTLDEADTNKFELYYVDQEQAIEIASAGVFGPNVNPLMYVENIDRDSNRQIFEKQFAGLRFGVARLALVYDLFRRSLGS